MKKLAKRISRKEWGMILLAILFTCFSVYLELEVPTYISKITDLLELREPGLDELWQPASNDGGNVLSCLLVLQLQLDFLRPEWLLHILVG